MPEHLRALIVIVVLAGAVFLIGRRPACGLAMTDHDFVRRRNLWFAVTLIAFLAHNFWLFLALAGAVLYLAGRKERNVMALYLLLLFAVPPFSARISGLGLVNQLLSIDYPRLLAIALLLPAALRLRRSTRHEGRFLPDYLIVGYVLVQLGLQYSVDSLTNTARYGVYDILDIGLPYYVASRSLRDVKAFREAAMSLVLACTVLAVIAVFETARHWLLYASLDHALDVQWGLGAYLGRNALLRAQATTGQPIVLAYILSVALAAHVYLRRSIANPSMWALGFAALSGGLVATLSRGPWIGAVVALLVFRVAGPKAIGGLLKVGMAIAALGAIVMVSPLGAAVSQYLPFVGNIDTDNITYRQNLLEISTRIILQNPWFGSYDFLARSSFDSVRQGNAGFVDLVNTYVGIGLANGLVGLSFFVGAFVAAGAGIVIAMRRLPDPLGEARTLGQGLLAGLAGIMAIIFTVSSISFIPVVYWTVVGLAVGYAAMLRQPSHEVTAEPADPEPAPRGLRVQARARAS